MPLPRLSIPAYLSPATSILRLAEGVIAATLAAGLALSFVVRQPRVHWLRLAAQGFALLGTLVGLFTIAIGVGPRTVPDLVYHAMIIVLLVWDLTVAVRAGSRAAN